MGIHERITALEGEVESLKSGETAGSYDAAIESLGNTIAALGDELKAFGDLAARLETVERDKATAEEVGAVHALLNELAVRVTKLERTRTVAKRGTATGGNPGSDVE